MKLLKIFTAVLGLISCFHNRNLDKNAILLYSYYTANKNACRRCTALEDDKDRSHRQCRCR